LLEIKRVAVLGGFHFGFAYLQLNLYFVHSSQKICYACWHEQILPQHFIETICRKACQSYAKRTRAVAPA
jgi:hypothetical protein